MRLYGSDRAKSRRDVVGSVVATSPRRGGRPGGGAGSADVSVIVGDRLLDTVLGAGWEKNIASNAQAIADEFAKYLKANQDNIAALTIFFSQPYRRRELSYDLIRQVLDEK